MVNETLDNLNNIAYIIIIMQRKTIHLEKQPLNERKIHQKGTPTPQSRPKGIQEYPRNRKNSHLGLTVPYGFHYGPIHQRSRFLAECGPLLHPVWKQNYITGHILISCIFYSLHGSKTPWDWRWAELRKRKHKVPADELQLVYDPVQNSSPQSNITCGKVSAHFQPIYLPPHQQL